MSSSPKGADRKAPSTPDPDDPAKPDSPTALSRRSWTYVARKTFREFVDDQCLDLAAALTYYSVLAIFPAAVALLSLLGVVVRPERSIETVMQVLGPLVSPEILGGIRPTLEQLARSDAAALALVLGVLAALWSASGYVGAFGRAMNRIYEISEGRPFWKLRPVMLLITLLAVLLIGLVMLMLILSGPVAESVGDVIGLGEQTVLIWEILKWPIIALAVMLIVAMLYYATPNVQQPKFRWISVGAAVAIAAWLVASALFALYLATFADYSKTYGSLAGVVIGLLFLWITNLALLFGAELDSELERGRELQAGMPAEEELQLPARDTRNIEKSERKEEQDIERGRELRAQATEDHQQSPSTPTTTNDNEERT